MYRRLHHDKRRKKQGYWIRAWFNPELNRQVTQREHRYLWEQEHGAIPHGHVIHHINKDTLDNRLDNLQPLTNGDHMALHAFKDGRYINHITTYKTEWAQRKRERIRNDPVAYAAYLEKNRLHMQEYVARNRDKINEQRRARKQEIREDYNAYQRQYYATRKIDNPEAHAKLLAKVREYRHLNADIINAKRRKL